MVRICDTDPNDDEEMVCTSTIQKVYPRVCCNEKSISGTDKEEVASRTCARPSSTTGGGRPG